MKLEEYELETFKFKDSQIEICYHSDIGGREKQEDFYTIKENGESLIVALCDGMGGSKCGELASKIAADHICNQFCISEEINSSFFVDNIEDLDAIVYFLKDKVGTRLNAGTTMVSIIIDKTNLWWLSIGDSRLYIIRNNEIVQATKDHNYKEMLLDLLNSGSITPEQYENEKDKYSALTSYMGIGGVKLYSANTTPLTLYNDDILLLTTDGLYNQLNIDDILHSSNNIEDVMKTALEKIEAQDSINRDNTTFILIKYIAH